MGLPTFGRYLLQERVATGGMAEVYRALYRPAPGVEKTVALKRVLPHLALDEDFRVLFRQEAAVSARLSHANVVQLLDVGEVEGEPFLALEFVHGRNLRQVLKRCGERRVVMPIGLALHVVMEAAKGLAYAHALRDAKGQPLGIVHRDVSPANILVSYEGEVKVADFGIARASAYASTTKLGLVRGKASYMSPEQARGDAVDGRSDVFALGAVLWELLTGRRLFAADSESEIIAKVLNGPMIRPSQAAPGVPTILDDLLAKALARDRETRFPDALVFSRFIATAISRLGPPIASADLATWMRTLFSRELEAEVAAVGVPRDLPIDSSSRPSRPMEDAIRGLPHEGGLPPANASAYADDLEPEVKPLPIEERRKLFDLPAPTRSESSAPKRPPIAEPAKLEVVRPPAPAPLELAGDAEREDRERRVTRVHVGDPTSSVVRLLRLAIFGVFAGAMFFAGLLLVFRS